MNVLILINSAPKYKFFYHELAQVFSLHGHNIYYAIDSISSKYMEPVKEIDESKNSFYFSSYLEMNYNKDFKCLYECTYGDFFYSDFDRFLTHKYNLNKTKKYWEKVRLCLDSFFYEIITAHKIDLVLYENISNSFAYSAWRIAELLGVEYRGLMGARLPGRFEIQSSIIDKEVDKIKKNANMKISREDEEWFYEYKKNITNIQPDYMKNNSLNTISLNKLFKFSRLKTFFRILKSYYYVDDYYEFQRGSIIKKMFNNTYVNIHRYITSKVTRKFFISATEIKKLSEKYYVYPIHYHPESSTSVLAPSYTNEYSNIINIANNLKFGTFLYVKDHISAKGIQSYNFYKKIAALPNVRLISSVVNIKELIRHSLGVITINSTAGYEALLLEKPVYLFGRVFYECFPYVYKMDSFIDLRNISLEEDFCISRIVPWYVAYRKYTYEGTLHIGASSSFDQRYYVNIYNNIMSSLTVS
ncbi:capsular biosynthesis protein [Escherichia coli]|uniref:Capsular biosynthesis protein n=1 Tax=Escherichia coli TaxID=562 RepID=A0A5P0J7H7_ECOLX|nr:capsular biosynthesis protein [Escherichia coli]ELD0467366.1 hypothetical protein [Escherichia coli]MQK14655.1 capsular biosynthesis protein [Escherichia coli]MQK24718.1 capsular biosynthesis protein [Escherichia coli]HAW1912279.1 capsular biosynthesis protein [Escherichia coli]HAW2027171.1 capsular biosynthesis protein [Escherichia coli]